MEINEVITYVEMDEINKVTGKPFKSIMIEIISHELASIGDYNYYINLKSTDKERGYYTIRICNGAVYKNKDGLIVYGFLRMPIESERGKELLEREHQEKLKIYNAHKEKYRTFDKEWMQIFKNENFRMYDEKNHRNKIQEWKESQEYWKLKEKREVEEFYEKYGHLKEYLLN